MKKSAENAERILILAPSGNDAANAAMVLHRAGIAATICEDSKAIVRNFEHGAGALLVAQEALTNEAVANLTRILQQPPWSDIPLIIITGLNEAEGETMRLLQLFPHGNVTLMERPLRATTLTSALNVALRARRRQYEIRNFLAEQEKTLKRIREDERRFRAVFNQQFQFMALLSPDGVVFEINDLPLLTSGIKREEALGKLFWETPFWAHLPEMQKTWPQRLAHAAKTNGPVLSVDEFETAAGEVRIADAAVTAVKGTDGKVEFFIIQASDITERTRAEAALRDTSQRYKTLFESIDVGFCVIEVIFDQNKPIDYRFIEVNPAFEKQTGLRDAAGKRMRELAPAHEQIWFDTYGKVAKTGEPVRFQNEAQALNRWFDVYAFRIGKPNLHRVAILFTDVTERNRTEEALRQSEERYRTLVSQVQDYAIFTVDLEGHASSFNEGVNRVFGWDEKEFIGHNVRRDFTPADVANGVPERELEYARQHGRASNDRWMRRSNGDEFWASGVTTPLRNAKGEIIGFTKVLRDLTARKKMEQELEESRRQLQQHARELEQRVAERTARLQETISELEAFSYSVSHDLRAPLRAMQGYSHFLLEDYAGQLDAAGQDFINRIVKAAERLDRLVSDILTYSRAGRTDIKRDVVNVERLIRDVVMSYPALQKENADIELQSPLLPVLGHEGSLTQCISNLLANAVKFMPDHQKPRVRIWTEPRGKCVRINFKDNGIGIPPAHQERIFKMFEKGPHDKSYEGTGIGLAIVRKAVERMDGSIGVESTPGQGSLFWLELPAP